MALPLFVVHLGAGQDAAGLVWAALEAGAILGTLAIARLGFARQPHHVVIAGTAAFGITLIAWPRADSLGTLVASAALGGLPQGPVLPALFAVRQRFAPTQLLAQVATTGASLKIGAHALGAGLGDMLAEQLSPSAMIALSATAQLAAAGLGSLAACRHHGRRDDNNPDRGCAASAPSTESSGS